jgi:hypothetical protein
MKQFKLLYALLFAVAVIACKDDDESPTFKKEDLVGTWEENDSEIQGCTFLIKIDATKFYNFGTKCDDDIFFSDGYTFTFDGKQTFTFTDDDTDTDYKYVILSKNATTLKADVYVDGTKFSTDTFTKLP